MVTPDPEPTIPNPDAINLVVQFDHSGIGASYLIAENTMQRSENEYNITIATSNDDALELLSSGKADIAAIATNTASQLYFETDGSIQILALNTFGDLSLLEKGSSVNNLSDLDGKTIWMSDEGTNVQYILTHLLAEEGLIFGDDVTIE